MRETRRDGLTFAVLYRINGRQTSTTFKGARASTAAGKYRDLVEKVGGEHAEAILAGSVGSGGASPDRDMPTVTQLVEDHIDSLSGVEGGTKSDYRSYVRLSLKDTPLGKMFVDEVDEDDVSDWINLLAETYREKSIKNRHSLVSAAFARAIKKKLRLDNPAKGAQIPESEVEDPVFLTHEEFAILYGHFTAFWRPFIATMAGTGMRFGEQTASRVQDAHLDQKVPALTIVRAWKHTDGNGRKVGSTKTKRGRRTIGLGPSVVRVLRPLVEGRVSSEFIFTNTIGNPVRHNTFHERVWAPAIRRATATHDDKGNEIPPNLRLTKSPTPHDLRHSHASWLIAEGVPLTEIQYRLGHESIKTTSDLYGHLMPGHLERSAHATETALAQALPEVLSIGV